MTFPRPRVPRLCAPLTGVSTAHAAHRPASGVGSGSRTAVKTTVVSTSESTAVVATPKSATMISPDGSATPVEPAATACVSSASAAGVTAAMLSICRC